VPGAPARTPAEMVQALDRTWRCMADCLARWNADDMRHTFPDDWDGKHVVCWLLSASVLQNQKEQEKGCHGERSGGSICLSRWSAWRESDTVDPARRVIENEINSITRDRSPEPRRDCASPLGHPCSCQEYRGRGRKVESAGWGTVRHPPAEEVAAQGGGLSGFRSPA
jgi:hypothetical protein